MRVKEEVHAHLTSDEVKQKRADTVFKRNFSPEKIQKYLDSLKHTYYSPDFDRTIHIPLKP